MGGEKVDLPVQDSECFLECIGDEERMFVKWCLGEDAKEMLNKIRGY